MKKLLAALSGQPSSPPPFWFMRQAGRYLPEYKATRAEAGSFLNLCFNPELAAEVTLQPLRRFDMDAAILFADILVIPLALGQDLKFETGEGPKLGALSVERLAFSEEKLEPIYETLKLLTTQLPNHTTLIGFAGSPWTVATYMVEGGSSRDFAKAKTYPEMEKLLDIPVESTSQYLISQINAGAEVVQIFDSWASALGGSQFEKWVIEPNARIVANIRAAHPNTPIICFPKNSSSLPPKGGVGGSNPPPNPSLREGRTALLKKFVEVVKPNGISLDHNTDLAWAFDNLGCTIQGNLDPELLLGDQATLKTAAEKILKTAAGKPFIFNLGHGINQHTPVENVELLSEIIKQN